MEERNLLKPFILLVLLQIILFPTILQGAIFVVGKVHDAKDCMDSAWRPVRVYLPGEPNNFEIGTVNPETGYFTANAGEGGLGAGTGDIVLAEVMDKGDGYTAGPVQLEIVSTEANLFPDMYLAKEGIVTDPAYPNCPDCDNDYVNDVSDNCMFTYNPFQPDDDEDGIGNQCDKCDGRCNCSAANLDGSDPVDFSDLLIIVYDWAQAGENLAGDVDGDQFVDLYDLAILAQYWLSACRM